MKTKFEARDVRYQNMSVEHLKDTNSGTLKRVSFNVYAWGVLCGRLTMTEAQFDEFTARLRAEEVLDNGDFR